MCIVCTVLYITLNTARTHTYAYTVHVVTASVFLSLQHFQQFWTYYPHTPDNSFLGTVVEKPAVKKTGRRLNRGLIYGKSGLCSCPVMP